MTALLIALIIGAIAGWLAGQVVQGTGFGLIGDLTLALRARSSPRCFFRFWVPVSRLAVGLSAQPSSPR